MKYIESKSNGDGTYDHTEVRAAYENGSYVETEYQRWPGEWCIINIPNFATDLKYRASVPDTYGIHESSSTLREVKGDAGPAVAEMLLDRIKELEDDLSYALDALNDWACYGSGADPEMDSELIRARAALNKEQK